MYLELKLTCKCKVWMYFTADNVAAVGRGIPEFMQAHNHYGDTFTLRCGQCGKEFEGGPKIFPRQPQRGALEATKWMIQHDHRVPVRVQ